jgi:hypothetical protein
MSREDDAPAFMRLSEMIKKLEEERAKLAQLSDRIQNIVRGLAPEYSIILRRQFNGLLAEIELVLEILREVELNCFI